MEEAVYCVNREEQNMSVSIDIKENDLENGQVTASMEVITGIYKEKLRTGF